MSRIRSTDTKPEILVRKVIFQMGFRFRLHVKDHPGKPDIVLPRHNKIILVHGCFWHLHLNCLDGRIPTSRTDYWLPKLTRNKNRDSANLRALKKLGWQVLVVWECETTNSAILASKLRRFLS